MPSTSFRPSPLLLHQPTPTPNPSNPFQMPQSPSRSASPSVFNSVASTVPPSTSSSPHQIPFNPSPVHHAPSPLGFGFGFGSSFGNNNNLTASPSVFAASSNFSTINPASSSAATTALAHSFASLNAVHASASPKRSDAKRRRDVENDQYEDDEDMEHQLAESPRPRANHLLPESIIRADSVRQIAPKRLRAAGVHSSLDSHTKPLDTPGNLHTKSISSRRKNVMSGLEVDLGKLLASMDKASLLTMLHKLLTQSKDADLGAQILSLLPTPSLETVEAALDEVEKSIRAAIPFVAQTGTTGVRDEYTWSRARAPIMAFADTALSYMPFFVTEFNNTTFSCPISSTSNNINSAHSSASKTHRDEVHPATTFTFLHDLTSRVLRIHALLPPVPKSSLSFSSLRQERSPNPLGFGFAFASNHNNSTLSNTQQQRSGARDPHENLANRLASHFTSPTSPDALMSTLMPVLLKQWTILLQRLDRDVNREGRMFGQEVVLGWARALDAVGSRAQPSAAGEAGLSFGVAQPSQLARQPKAEEIAIRETMDEVRNRLESHLGWLVGGHDPAHALPRPAQPQRHDLLRHQPQQQHEHAQSVQKRSTDAHQALAPVKRARSTFMDDEEEL